MQNHTHPPTQKSKPGEKKKKKKEKKSTPQPLTFLPSSFCSRSVRPRCRPAQYVILSYPSRSVPLATLFLSIPVPISLSRISFSPVVVALFLSRPPARAVAPPSATDSSTSHLLPYHLCFYRSLPRSVIFYLTTFFYHFLSPFTLPPSLHYLLPYLLLYHFLSSFTLPPALSLSIIFYLATSFTTLHRLLPFSFFLYPQPFSIFTDPPAASASSVRPHIYFVTFYLSGFFFII